MDETPFPILGEPFTVELANTAYRIEPEPLDVLADRLVVPRWLAAVPDAASLSCPARPGRSWHRRLLDLRDATRQSLDAMATGTRPPQEALDLIAATAAGDGAVTRRRRIEWQDGPRLVVGYCGPVASRSLVAMADTVVDFLTGDRAPLVRCCEADDCPMLFVRQHARRRWCHDGCGHRNRQARYYRRRRDAGR